MEPGIVTAIFAHVPLNWVGYAYFTEFLERLDPRLVGRRFMDAM